MTGLPPETSASRHIVLALAKEVAARHPDHYGAVPPSHLALGIRELVRFCEDCGIWEPDDLSGIVRAMFAPAPACLAQADRDYALSVLSNRSAAPEARARSVVSALTGAAPPPREPIGPL